MKGIERLEAYYRKVAEADGKPFARSVFYPSECGACPRRVYYSMLGISNRIQQPSSWMLKRAGKIYHEAVQGDLRKAYGKSLVFCEESLEADFEVDGKIFPVRGRVDGGLGKETILEIKTMGKDAFRAILQRGIRGRPYFMDYVRQGTLYGMLLERIMAFKPKIILVIPVCRDTGEVHTLGVPSEYDPRILEPTWESWGKVLDGLAAEELPERKYEQPDFIECGKFCGCADVCWGKA